MKHIRQILIGIFTLFLISGCANFSKKEPDANAKKLKAAELSLQISEETNPDKKAEIAIEILKIEPNNQVAFINLIQALEKTSNYQLQKNAVSKLIQISAKHPENVLLLSGTLHLIKVTDTDFRAADLLLNRFFTAHLNKLDQLSAEELERFIPVFKVFAMREAAFENADLSDEIYQNLLELFDKIPEKSRNYFLLSGGFFYQNLIKLSSDSSRFFGMANSQKYNCRQNQKKFIAKMQSHEDNFLNAELPALLKWYCDSGVPEKAEALLKKFAAANSNGQELPFCRAWLEFAKKNYPEAFRRFEALFKAQNDERLCEMTFQAAKLAKDFKNTEKYATIIAEKFNNPHALIIFYLERKSFENVKKSVVKYFNADVLWRDYYLMNLAIKSKNFIGAKELADKYSEFDFKNAAGLQTSMLLLSLEIYAQTSNANGIWKIYELMTNDRQLAADPNLNNAIAYTLAENNLAINEEEKLIEKAYYAEPDQTAFIDTYAWVLFKKGKINQAKKFIEMALKRLPYESFDSNGEIYFHAGEIYQATGEIEKAQNFYKSAAQEPESENFLPQNAKAKIK